MRPTRLLNADQAGERLCIHASSVRKMWCNGELSYVDIGRGRKVSDAEISRYIEEHEKCEPTA